MSWEDQGRQYHAWFGHGTGPGPLGSAVDPTPQQVAAMIAKGAAAYLSGGLQANYQRSLDNGWAAKLARAIPIWAASSSLDPASFRSLLAGPALSSAGAEGLQRMAQVAAKATGPAEIAAASQQLADVVKDGGENWRYQLGYAHSQAVYAWMNKLVPDGPSEKPLSAPATPPVPAAAAESAPATIPASTSGQRAVHANRSSSSPLLTGNDKRQYCIDRCTTLALPTRNYGVSFFRCYLTCMGENSFPEWEQHFQH